jgi:CheY-like chemotaxis protein
VSRILVIDDEPEVLQLIAKVLVRAGHEVDLAPNGEAGLERLATFAPDLLIVDKMLPQMHGGEVIARARAQRPDLAVMMITAFPEPLTLGPERLDAYLPKPFKTLAAIEEAVKSALESAEAARKRNELKERLSQVMAELAPLRKKS